MTRKKEFIGLWAVVLAVVFLFMGCDEFTKFLGGGEEPENGGGNPLVLKAEAPVAVPGAGSAWTMAQNVVLSTATVGVDIYYTLDETDPAENGTKYDDVPVTVSPGETLMAVAVKADWTASEVTAVAYEDATAFVFDLETGSITGYTGNVKNLVIPGTINGTLVAAIENNAFKEKKTFTSVTIPDGVITIGTSAFENNLLTGVTIGNSVETIKEKAFHTNNSLTDVTIPGSVTSIEDSAFMNTTLISVTMPANINSVVNAFPSGLTDVYNIGKAAGTYTRPNTGSDAWAKQ
jgi:hypothetical protein